ncbi:MAG: MOSC domain-containing protein [Alphaproteobacteria bacterium]|nr:MOSC domain-containing protein [Alphaproteobacteria bacterium]
MKLLSVNVSLPKEIDHRGKTVTTGIFKEPVDGRVMLRGLNLDGDGQADLIGHGGKFRAVYVYSYDNYAYWKRELGRTDFAFGQFGENFTVEGMLDDAIHVGDVFRVGGALVEVTQPRVPCFKLAIRMGLEGFQNLLLSSNRIGFYLRVLEEGEVGAGDVIEPVKTDPRRMTVGKVNNLLYFDLGNLEDSRKALRIKALSPGWRGSFEDRLAKAETSGKATEGFRTLIVDRKVPESDTITSFYLVPEDAKPLPSFIPGQFLPFRLDIPGQPTPLTRTYSLSDRPNPEYYRLSIKREPPPGDRPDLPPGRSSNYFHDRVEAGTRLRARSPRGKFYLDPRGERPVALISAGVGLTPMISMLNAIVEAGSGRPVWFIHGARNGREHAMGAHVRAVAGENDNVRAHISYSRPLPDDVEGRDHDGRGRVDGDLLKRLLPDNDLDFYLCGPTPFMKALYNGLLGWGVPEGRIHYEFFGPGSALTEGDGADAAADCVECSAEIEVTFSRSGLTAKWNPSFASILDMAEGFGLSPDYSCRSGICHTCMCALEDGEVEYVEEPLDPPDPGSVLICCSKPKTDLVVDA